MPYMYLEDRATADVAFKAWGVNLEELFRSCADALLAIMISNPELIHPSEEKIVELEADSIEILLHNFLQEILYFKDAYQLFMKVKEIEIMSTVTSSSQQSWLLKATFFGEAIELHKDDLLADIKGVTFHDFSIENRKDGIWEATVVVDV